MLENSFPGRRTSYFVIGTWLEHSWVRFVENEAREKELCMWQTMQRTAERRFDHSLLTAMMRDEKHLN